jgi:hypothetical protein
MVSEIYQGKIKPAFVWMDTMMMDIILLANVNQNYFILKNKY